MYREMKIVVTIPIYKETPSSTECLSFKRCIEVLHNYQITIFCPNSLDLHIYENIAGNELHVLRFEDKFFSSIDGYCSLVMSHAFYTNFINYDYMLLYQLDAWIFEDKLEEWCNKGYDYIGAPCFEPWGTETPFEKKYISRIQNGGFCLRKIEKFLKITDPETPIYTWRYLFSKNCSDLRAVKRCIARCLGLRPNSMKFLITSPLYRGDDYYFCDVLSNTGQALKMPIYGEALKFCIYAYPEKMMDKLDGKLPMGCHGWSRPEYIEFWKLHIPGQ